MKRRELNFIPASANIRILQAATFTAVIGAVLFGSTLFTGRIPLISASISDVIASPSFSVLPSGIAELVKPKAISEHAVVSAANDVSGESARYYERDTGKAFSVSLTTLRTDILSDQRLPEFVSSMWIPSSQRVVSAFQRPAGLEYRFYDYATGASSVIGSDIVSVAVSPDGERLAQVRKTGFDSASVVLSALDGSGARELFSTRADEFRIAWRTNDSLSVISRRNDRPGYDLSLVSDDGSWTFLLKNKENLGAAWSPDGLYLLYSFFVPDRGVMLWLRSFETSAETPLGVWTSADKCTWHPSGYTVTCGVPLSGSLVRDVPAGRTATIDSIDTYDFDEGWFVRRYTGTKEALVGVSGPFISRSGKHLVFTNTFDSRLYLLPLR